MITNKHVSDIQILVSKDYSPIERSQDFGEMSDFRVWSRESEGESGISLWAREARKCSNSKGSWQGTALQGSPRHTYLGNLNINGLMEQYSNRLYST